MRRTGSCRAVQLVVAGWSEARIRQPLRARRWQVVHPRIYATHTGPIGYDARLLAASALRRT